MLVIDNCLWVEYRTGLWLRLWQGSDCFHCEVTTDSPHERANSFYPIMDIITPKGEESIPMFTVDPCDRTKALSEILVSEMAQWRKKYKQEMKQKKI